jgi:hypothetical protein
MKCGRMKLRLEGVLRGLPKKFGKGSFKRGPDPTHYGDTWTFRTYFPLGRLDGPDGPQDVGISLAFDHEGAFGPGQTIIVRGLEIGVWHPSHRVSTVLLWEWPVGHLSSEFLPEIWGLLLKAAKKARSMCTHPRSEGLVSTWYGYHKNRCLDCGEEFETDSSG